MEDSQSIRSEPNTKLHRLYQLSKSLLYLSPPLVVQLIGAELEGGMALENLRLSRPRHWHRASGISGTGIWHSGTSGSSTRLFCV